MAKHQFQTEIGQLLKLMTHSLYSNKEIFLRELVSNASDALDKFNHLRLTDENFKQENWAGAITIKLDKSDNSISIIDNGIGMDENDIQNNLGTIAKSGTKAFIEQLSGDAKKDSNLIGQFGVGFYSVFMVSSHVDVITKKAGCDQAYKFSTNGEGEYELTPVTKESHGTVIYIKLKEEEKEFLDSWRTKEVVKKYSNHIAYPITLNFEDTEYEGEGDERKEKTVNKSEKINEAKALWIQSKSELKQEDYVEFYKNLSGDHQEPLTYLHNKVEGSQEFTTLFYIPSKAPMDLYRADYKPGVKLYVKRVFITDDDKELLPPYLRFVRGIIDSEDLPLNVSREILQENKILANIKQNAIKKIIGAIKKLDSDKMATFTNEYNRVIKEGIYSDFTNKEQLLDIVRYKSSKEEGFISLDDYISRADSEKKEIYYIVGPSEAILRSSPLLEAYTKAGIEVLLMDDEEVDSIVTPVIGSYKEYELKDITAIEPPESKTKEEKEEISKEFTPLLDKIKSALGEEVKEVKISSRLTSSASCVVKDSSDPMASMAAMFAQMGQEMPKIPHILEINAEHDMVKKLQSLSDDALFDDIAWLLLDNALLSEGLEPVDKTKYAARVTNLATKAL